MGLREITGYIAHLLLAVYWVWIVSSTAPQLRRSSRDRAARVRILLIKTAAVVLTALLVGVIHFWATEWWHVIAAVIVAALLGRLLNRMYRRIVAAPRHRRTFTQRARKFERGPQEMRRPLPLPGQPAEAQQGAQNGHELRRRLSAPLHRHAR